MINSRLELKKYFLPVYVVWAIISPSLILLINPISGYRVVSFYALFGLIWPLSFVVYPAFYMSITQNNTTFELFSFDIAIPLFFIAWLGPVIHFGIAIYYHMKYLQTLSEEDKPISFLDYLSGYLA